MDSLSTSEREQLKKQILRDFKPQVEEFVRQEVARQLGSKVSREKQQEVTLDVLFKFFRQLANRQATFKNLS